MNNYNYNVQCTVLRPEEAQMKPTDHIDSLAEGLMACAIPRVASCLYCKVGIVADIMPWGQVSPVQWNNMPEEVLQATIFLHLLLIKTN